MSYLDLLKRTSEDTNSILCMGIDPVLEKIPLTEGTAESKITEFYLGILDEMIAQQIKPAAVKPNIAYFEQYGFDGLRALKEIIGAYSTENIPIILDAKRGDIGKTAEAYAKAVFDFWEADAVTVNPLLGRDSVQPFLEFCNHDRGVYVLCRTSNSGAKDFQNVRVGGTPLYLKIAEKILQWHEDGIGVVVGATSLKELQEITLFFSKSGKEIPFLIPGVGSQGGSAKEVVHILEKSKQPLSIHRINASSSINYAFEKYKDIDYAEAAVAEIKKLNKECGY